MRQIVMPPALLQPDITCRMPVLDDAASIWRLVRDSEALDQNSPYAYLLVCSHFARTSRVAVRAGALVGFVAGYRPPDAPDVYFVWQIGTAAGARGLGAATRLLVDVVEAERAEGVRHIEATVTPSNAASAALFRSVARRYDAPCAETTAFPSRRFPDAAHEDEILFRIGPLAALARPAHRRAMR